MKNEVMYPKGNVLTFPLELAQVEQGDEKEADLDYLYPVEMASLQKMVSEVCDQMEYDGSMMYDNCPDKVTLQRMASSICCHRKQCCDKEEDNPWMRPVVEMMLCNEMNCRRQKRYRHKNRIQQY